MFEDSFPISIKKEYEKVIHSINTADRSTDGIQDGYNSQNEWYILTDGTALRFPYRMYYTDNNLIYKKFSATEKLIYSCIFTRNCDGYIRQKHIANILEQDIPEWCFPYILRLSSEYVVEILMLIYDYFKNRYIKFIYNFCSNNVKLINRSYQRMFSYWNVYYRYEYPAFNDYVGKRLFDEYLLI